MHVFVFSRTDSLEDLKRPGTQGRIFLGKKKQKHYLPIIPS